MGVLSRDVAGLAIALCLAVGVVVLSLHLLDRFWPPDARRSHNDVIGFMISVIAVIYAILLGFVTFTVWENYDKALAAVDAEVNLTADIYRDAGSLPAPAASAIRGDLASYLRAVRETEWQAQTDGACQPRQSGLNDIPQYLQAAAKRDPAAAAFVSEMVSRLNQLYDARRARLFACNRSVPAPIWSALGVGSITLIGISLLFGFHDRRVHVAMSGLLSTSIGLVLWIVFELSTPFRGATAISPELYGQMLAFLQGG